MTHANRSIIYIDGFNLYYGALAGSKNKWLDIQRYFELLRQHDDIRQIYYFTAMVSGPTRADQETLIRALGTLSLVEVRIGKFKQKSVKCKVNGCHYLGDRRFGVTEEKRTDVAICVQMVEDAYQDQCDRFVLVTGDSDMIPAVHAIKRRFPRKQIIVYVPARDSTRQHARRGR